MANEPEINREIERARQIRENPDILLNGLPKPSIWQTVAAGISAGANMPRDRYSVPGGVTALEGLATGFNAYQPLQQQAIAQRKSAIEMAPFEVVSPKLAQEFPMLVGMPSGQATDMLKTLSGYFATKQRGEIMQGSELDETDYPAITLTLKSKGYTDEEINQVLPSLKGQSWAVVKSVMPKAIAPAIKPTIAQSTADRLFAKTYESYIASGGYADALGQIESLKEILAKLEENKGNLTGPVIASQPEETRVRLYPESYAAQQQVENSIQRSLRQTLGAQFTEKEGQLFMQRGYDPRLPEKINAQKLRRLISTMESAAKSKQEAVDYYEKNGTLTGFKGKTYILKNGELVQIGGPRQFIPPPLDLKNASADEILKAAEGK